MYWKAYGAAKHKADHGEIVMEVRLRAAGSGRIHLGTGRRKQPDLYGLHTFSEGLEEINCL
jgi:hypothetical protein